MLFVFVISSSSRGFVLLFYPTGLLVLQEHYGLCFSNFTIGFYGDDHPSMPHMPYLELKGLIVTKSNKIREVRLLCLIQGTRVAWWIIPTMY